MCLWYIQDYFYFLIILQPFLYHSIYFHVIFFFLVLCVVFLAYQCQRKPLKFIKISSISFIELSISNIILFFILLLNSCYKYKIKKIEIKIKLY